MATEKKKPSAKGKPVKYDKPEPLKCAKCGCPTHTLYGGKCFTCHVYEDEK